jgi:thiosulfate/3-mercaptopyruvate sulfurtransferase
MRSCVRTGLVLTFALAAASVAAAQSDLPSGSPQLINPQDLVNVLQAPKEQKPLILNVGPSLLYMQAHIPGAEYIGAASTPQGMHELRGRVKALPKNTAIVLYCGCCPWSHCPNVGPAYNELHKLGFSNVKVLYIADNFGTDWVDKGYPTIRNQ